MKSQLIEAHAIEAQFDELQEKIADVRDAFLFPDEDDLNPRQTIQELTDIMHTEVHRLIAFFDLSDTNGSTLKPVLSTRHDE